MATETTSAASAVFRSSSPTPSPQRRRRRKHQDSFSRFLDATSTEKSSAEKQEDSPNRGGENDTEDSLLRRIFVNPLLSASFIISLFLVEHRDRSRRASEHAPSNTSFWSTFTLKNWLDPEPYQDPSDTTWKDSETSDGQVPTPAKREWFMRKKHRKMSKLQIGDALELRGTVMVVLLVVACITLITGAWLCTKAYRRVMGKL